MTRSVLVLVLATSALAGACASRPIPCEIDDDCPAGCCRPNARGELFCSSVCPCDTDADCVGGFCVPDASMERVCMPECPVSRETTCFDGTYCHDIFDGRRVCWPGGTVPLGGACTLLLECQRGAFCVGLSGATGGTCVRACELMPGGVEPCPVGTMCQLTIQGDGFCPRP